MASQTAEIWRRPELARLAAVSCAASLCFFADAIKVTLRLVQRINVAFLVQGDSHAAASLLSLQAAARQCKALVVSRR
ncbi:hypothetical protein G5S56_09845 [Shigella boydii]|uniref:Uncharacterized protein n=1 Tax=Shigella boydii TaxID=621 RepID=A0A7G6KDR2_SHIBO|nr:hypothetical protein [Shigella boydii]EFZ0081118.1 hypothetical protein [Shigella flexneri]EFS3869624.1 hypothetical protein [Shigella boydii]EFZ0032210.1 hypothetical protein [Shigella boydii]EFZ6260833.1 hypothetical protein [Shigella boydii]EFZ6264368.1 hypothetical protein [Shigella boydii]